MFQREELMAAATEATGLSDFGDDGFEQALAVLLNSYNTEAQVTPLGEQLIREELIGDLKGRLKVVDQIKRCPEALEGKIEKPIFIVGLPRTGTTTIQNMLQHSPDCQVLEYWLGVVPQSRPPREQWESNPDYQQVAEVLRLTYEADPGLRALHDVSADGAGECRFAFRHSFKDDSYDHNSRLPSYRQWFDEQSMDEVYQWFRDVLKLIQYPNDQQRRWVLKYPPHLRCLEEIFRAFPDACIIQTHRDPAAVLPSFASLLVHFSSLYEKDVDPIAMGSFVVDLWLRRMKKGIDDRRKLNRENQFFDLHYNDVMQDPVGSVSRALAAFDLPPSPAALQSMQHWHDNHQPGRHGKHQYSAADFGLDQQVLSKQFAFYREHFDVAAFDA